VLGSLAALPGAQIPAQPPVKWLLPSLPIHRLLVAGRSFTTAQTWCACKRWTTSLSSNRPCCATGEGRRFIDARDGNELSPGAAAVHRTLPADSQARSGCDVPWLVPLPATKPAGMRESTPVAQATAKMGWPPSGERRGCVWVRRAAALRSRLTACALLHREYPHPSLASGCALLARG
jgi:hypothetical protein